MGAKNQHTAKKEQAHHHALPQHLPDLEWHLAVRFVIGLAVHYAERLQQKKAHDNFHVARDYAVGQLLAWAIPDFLLFFEWESGTYSPHNYEDTWLIPGAL